MSRDLSADNKAAAIAWKARPVLFAEFDFASGVIRVHSGRGTVSWGGYDWLGMGRFGSVTSVDENSELAKKTITYSLSGLPGDIIAIGLNEHYQGRSARLYLGFKSLTTNTLVDTPELLDQGRMNTIETEEGDTCSVSLTSESRLSLWDRPVIRRLTNADQQSRFPGDRGFEFINQAAQKEINWGRSA